MSLAPFKITMDDNQDGWGPSTIPDKFKEVPYYAPYSKGDKLGKVSDWTQQNTGRSNRFQKDKEASVNTIFNWYYQDDDNTFQTVDNTRVQAGGRGRTFGRKGNFQTRGYQQMRQLHQRGAWQQQQKGGFTKQQQQPRRTNLNKGWSNTNYRNRFQDNSGPNIRKREFSVEPKADWVEMDTIEFNQLNKLAGEEPKAQDISSYGFVEYYNKAYDRVSTKAEKILERTDRAFFNVTSSDDPVIRQLSLDGAGTVFATDAILSHLMTCTRSVYPWDIIVQKVGSTIFLDKRDNSQLDFLTVNETSNEPPADDGGINSPTPLSREATFINQGFSQQVLIKEEPALNFDKPNPFQTEEEKVAAIGYRYRKWNITDDIVLVARCEVDGVTKIEGKDVFLTIKAVNEFDPKGGVDWRKKIDSQRGAVITTELRNNSFKLAKWTVQSLLAGTDNIKLGYVSRTNPKDSFNHSILATQDFLPKEFATQINLNMKNAWGVLKHLLKYFLNQQTESGKYVILRDIDKNALRIYSVPADTFDDISSGQKEEEK